MLGERKKHTSRVTIENLTVFPFRKRKMYNTQPSLALSHLPILPYRTPPDSLHCQISPEITLLM